MQRVKVVSQETKYPLEEFLQNRKRQDEDRPRKPRGFALKRAADGGSETKDDSDVSGP